MDLSKELYKIDFLDFCMRFTLQKLLTELFADNPLILEIKISSDVLVRTFTDKDCLIILSVQIIWTEDNEWIEPIKLKITMNEKGEIQFADAKSESHHQQLRFYEIARRSPLWNDQKNPLIPL